MKLAWTPETSELTGLSVDTLREWTVRRALIPADVPPRAKGSPAQYSWQTVLILRLAVSMRNRFQIELQAHKVFFAQLKDAMRHLDPAELSSKALLLKGEGKWELVDDRERVQGEVLVIQLRPYLESLAEFFGFVGAYSEQFELFPGSSLERKEPRGTGTRKIIEGAIA